MHLSIKVIVATLLLVNSLLANAGQLALVMDDFGYRPHEEHKVLKLPAQLSIAVLPDAPYSQEMATLAHQHNHEVLIHLPMAPLSKQPLEKNTLTPEMSGEQVRQIIDRAIGRVPYAIGLNNHMGSRMTSSLPGMQKVMQALQNHQLYFLDSVTIGSTQAQQAAAGTNVKVLRRRVFLDDNQNEAEVRRQFQRAIQIARREGFAIAIGHPHPSTVRVLQQELASLPSDITLVRPSELIGRSATRTTVPLQTAKRPQPRLHIGLSCRPRQPLQSPKASDAVLSIYQGIKQSRLVQDILQLF